MAHFWQLLLILGLTAVGMAQLNICNQDNCFTAMSAIQTPGHVSVAQNFCATFTKGSLTATSTIPAYADPDYSGNVASRTLANLRSLNPALDVACDILPGDILCIGSMEGWCFGAGWVLVRA